MFCKGSIAEVRQCSGCLEVVVTGESPGTFPIDNCCIWEIIDEQGRNWIGRAVEYENGQMRFLNSPGGTEEADSPRTIPFPDPACSSRHI